MSQCQIFAESQHVFPDQDYALGHTRCKQLLSKKENKFALLMHCCVISVCPSFIAPAEIMAGVQDGVD